jgi:hypothetical protein
MSVERYVHSLNGQEVERDDLNLLGDAGGLADDHVLAELLRLQPFLAGLPIAKAMLPLGSNNIGLSATVAPAGPNGSVMVGPFRAVVGSRDIAANIGGVKNWNDLRSAIFAGPNLLSISLPLQSNTTAQVRWDLVYAKLQVDAPGQQVSRYRKDPTTEQVTVVQISKSLVQAISVVVLAGTPGGPKPALPPDGGGTFFFPLAYVRVVPNFGPNSPLATTDIEELVPYVPLSTTTGACTLVPANQQYKEGGTVLSSANFAWGGGGGRPGPVLPPTMSGANGLLVALDVQGLAPSWSHASGGLVDDSRDWRNRVWRWHAMVSTLAAALFPWDRGGSAQHVVQATGNNPAFGFGQSFVPDQTLVTPPLPLPGSLVALLTPQNAGLAANSYIALAVDPTTGSLFVFINGTPGVRAFLWLEASGQFPNF